MCWKWLSRGWGLDSSLFLRLSAWWHPAPRAPSVDAALGMFCPILSCPLSRWCHLCERPCYFLSIYKLPSHLQVPQWLLCPSQTTPCPGRRDNHSRHCFIFLPWGHLVAAHPASWSRMGWDSESTLGKKPVVVFSFLPKHLNSCRCSVLYMKGF